MILGDFGYLFLSLHESNGKKCFIFLRIKFNISGELYMNKSLCKNLQNIVNWKGLREHVTKEISGQEKQKLFEETTFKICIVIELY